MLSFAKMNTNRRYSIHGGVSSTECHQLKKVLRMGKLFSWGKNFIVSNSILARPGISREILGTHASWVNCCSGSQSKNGESQTRF